MSPQLPCTKYVTASQDAVCRRACATPIRATSSLAVGVAYRPFNDTKTVVRAGFGIYTMTNLGPLSFNNSGNPTSSLHSYAKAQRERAAIRH